MTELPYLKDIFDKLRQGAYITHEQGNLHAPLTERYDDYASYFKPLGLDLVRHPRDFFYFRTETAESTPPPQSLPPIAVFCFILIEATANEGRPVEEYLLTERFSIAGLPHLNSDRFKAHMKAVGVDDEASLRKLIKGMARLGWAEVFPDDTFRFLRPFHRVFDKCQEISQVAEQEHRSALKDEEEINPEMN
ncbi:MAG: condensin complex protein MksE [Flavobacteriales bacterium]